MPRRGIEPWAVSLARLRDGNYVAAIRTPKDMREFHVWVLRHGLREIGLRIEIAHGLEIVCVFCVHLHNATGKDDRALVTKGGAPKGFRGGQQFVWQRGCCRKSNPADQEIQEQYRTRWNINQKSALSLLQFFLSRT